MKKSTCRCNEFPDGEKALRNKICLPINGRIQGIDFCIHKIVAALNAGQYHHFR